MEAQLKKDVCIFSSTDGSDMLGRVRVKKLGMVTASVRKIRWYCT